MPIRAGDMPIGTKVMIKCNNVPKECTVIHHGIPSSMYDASCNGTWIIMNWNEDAVYNFAVSHNNDYANSQIHSVMNSQIYPTIEPRVRDAIKQVRIPYRPGSGTNLSTINTVSNGLLTKLFAPSAKEVGAEYESNRCESGVFDQFTSHEDHRTQIVAKDGAVLSYYRPLTPRQEGINTQRSLWLRSPARFHHSNYSPPYDIGVCVNMPARWLSNRIFGQPIKSPFDNETPGAAIFPVFIVPDTLTLPGAGAKISDEDRNLGTFTTTAPSASYTITDPGNFAQTVTEKLNGTVLRTYNAVLGREETATIPADKWLETLNGDYTLTITATDVDGMEVVRTFTFKKAMNTLEFSTKEAIQADEMPIKAILNVQGAMPQGSIFKAEICNNGNDAAPAWEDVTESVKSGEKFFFKNKIKTAEKWGVKVRISLQRGTATGPCYIQSVGGNFD